MTGVGTEHPVTLRISQARETKQIGDTYTHTRVHTCVYTYMCVCVCVYTQQICAHIVILRNYKIYIH